MKYKLTRRKTILSMDFARSLWLSIFAMAPIFTSWIIKEFINPRPYWIHYDHVETLYYYTGMELGEGLLPSNLDNPGTLVQLVSAAIIGIIGDDPANFVIFRSIAHWLVVLFTLSVFVLLSRGVLSHLPGLIVVSSLWVYFLCSQSLEYLNVWSPEALYFIVGSVFIYTFIRACTAENKLANFFLAGVALGVCCSVKFTFLAWIPAYLASLLTAIGGPKFRNRISSIAVASAGILIGFVLMTWIVASGYEYMFGWLTRLVTHSGPYGSGSSAHVDIGQAITNWYNAINSAKAWVLFNFSLVVVIAIDIWNKRRNQLSIDPVYIGLLVFAVCSFLFSYLFVIRMFALRYLLPTGLSAFVLYYLVARYTWAGKSWVVKMVLFLCIGMLLLKHIQLDLRTDQQRAESGINIHAALNRIIDEVHTGDTDPTVVYSFRFPEPSFALRQNASRENHQAKIDRLYPSHGHYLPWTGVVRLPQGKNVWDFLVIRKKDVAGFPEQTGTAIGRLGNYIVYRFP